jgi:outer membrane receptor protein involved in Fe transport
MARRRIAALLGSISLVALTAPAYAAIETVVVTAEKRAEDVREVPMAVTVLGGESLERKSQTNFADFITSVPGMSYNAAEPGHTSLALRGINAGGVGATVGTYLDETPYGSSSALANGTITTPNIDTFDIARIEVLRGPQGTLYGSSTLGGLLKFVTNAPSTDGFDDKFEVGAVNLDNGGTGWSARGMVNVPVGDNAALRVSAYHDDTPGYIDDPGRGLRNINDARSDGGRASLLFNASDDLSVRFTVVMQNLNVGGNNVEDLALAGPNFAPLFGKYQQQRNADEFSDVAYRVYNGTVSWNLGWGDLTSTTSYDTFHDHSLTDGSGSPGVFFGYLESRLSQKKFTQEVRLASPADSGPFDWLIGGYYTHENGLLHQDVNIPGPTPPAGIILDLSSKYIETAGFASLTTHFSETFDLQVGGRYSHNSQSALELEAIPLLAIPSFVAASGVSTGNVFTWSVAPRVHLNDGTMLYARVAKGFRPGGPNALPPGPHPGVPNFYGADSLLNTELGVKTSMFDDTVSLDADLFMIDWHDIQLLVLSGGFGVNTNGSSARSQGFEWNIGWQPIDQLNVNFNGAFTDAHLTSDTDPLLVGAKYGARLPYTPRWGTSLDADYSFGEMGSVTPFAGISWRYVGERKSGFGGAVVPPTPNQFTLPSYNTVDLRAGVDWDNWTVELYGKNLSNADGITVFSASGNSAASGNAASAAIIQPREFGITVRGKI